MTDSTTKEFHIAPMLKVSYPEFRYWMRLLTKRAVIWTEMVVDETIVHHPKRLEAINPVEHPVICQVGGQFLDWTEQAAKYIIDCGFDEINLNAECPSTRVATKKQFGAALMLNIDLATQLMQVLHRVSVEKGVPASIKTRIAVDNLDGWDYLQPFIKRLKDEAHCRRFYMHARKVFTKGLSPAQNRHVPPLDYASVYRLCQEFPDCEFWINGGIRCAYQARDLCYGRETVPVNLQHASTAPPPFPAPSNLRGCLVGRTAMENPAEIAVVDTVFYGEKENPCKTRRQALEKYCSYLEQRFPRRCCDSDGRVTKEFPAPDVEFERDGCIICGDGKEQDDNDSSNSLKISSRVVDRAFKPVLGIFTDLPRARQWRRACNNICRDSKIRNCGPAFGLRRAMSVVPDDLLDRAFGAPVGQ